MFTEQILKSILSLQPFCASSRDRRPALEGIHVSVDVERKTITAMATDRYAAARMVIGIPDASGVSWDRNLSIAALKAALATVRAGTLLTSFPEVYMPEFPARINEIIDGFIASDDTVVKGKIKAKYLGAIAKIYVMGDKFGQWEIRQVACSDRAGIVARSEYGFCQTDVVIMPTTHP